MTANNIWEGIYRTFAQVPVKGDGYNSANWVRTSKEKIIQMQKENTMNETFLSYADNLFPFFCALKALEHKPLRILDFGGGLGITYLAVRRAVSHEISLRYDIIDLPLICRQGSKMFIKDKCIRFLNTFPQDEQHYDIVHIGSSLQYMEDWQGSLVRLDSFTPEYVFFNDLPAGRIPTFATVQRYYDSLIPYWFFNQKDIERVMNRLGFKLIFQSKFRAVILGKQQPLPMANFPRKYRLNRTCILLWKRVQ